MSAFDVAVGVAMLVGLVGTVLPILPGLVLIMVAAVVWAIWGEAGAVGWVVTVLILAVGVAAIALNYVVPARRASGAGAPRWVIAVGAVGVVLGFIFIPVVGALVGFPLAILVAELIRLRDLRAAWRSTLEALKGVGIGVAIQLAAGVVMIGCWVAGLALS